MREERCIGMVQPLVPMPDSWGPPPGQPDNPELYSVGCLGEVVECHWQPDGRYRIVLRGVSRFRIVSELPARKGYRRVRASYVEFSVDRSEPSDAVDATETLVTAAAVNRLYELELLNSNSSIGGAQLDPGSSTVDLSVESSATRRAQLCDRKLGANGAVGGASGEGGS